MTDTKSILSDDALDQIFRDARSQNGFLDKTVSDDQIRALYDLMKFGPTSMNCLPARIKFVRSQIEKDKLVACMAPPNQTKVASAPVTAVIGMDLSFVDTLPKLFPHADVRPFFAGNDALIRETAFRNSSLQGAYFIIAARSLGLDCGPMSGFNPQAVNSAFWSGTDIETNFVCTLGYGDPAKVFARLPRHDFEEICEII